MKTLFILMAVCGTPKIINYTKNWNEHDQLVLNRASRRCGEIWEDARCLKVFIKMQERRYKAGCGE